MNRIYRSQSCVRFRQHHLAGLLLGLVMSLLVVQSGRAMTGTGLDEQMPPSLNTLGLAQVLGDREFLVGLVAFEEKEYALARRHWAPMARLGHADSQFYMGLLHDVSVGIRPDARRAAIWYRLAADQGLPEAQQKLALAYARGEGVPRSVPEAIDWWMRAARQGHADSQYNLGVIYARGRDGIRRDIRKAAHWWRQAALGGDSMAQYNLGSLYANGEAGRTDLCQALHWWRKSQQNGFEQANVALRSLQGQGAARQCPGQADELQASF